MTPTSPPLARTPLYHWHAGHGARFSDCDGWQVPECYTGVESEVDAVRVGVGLCDVSAFVKTTIFGSGVHALSRELVGDGAAVRPLGVARFTASSPVLACRLTEDHLLLLASTTSPAGLEEHLRAMHVNEPVVRNDATTALAGFCLIGPATEDVLCRVTPLNVKPEALPPGSCAETSLAGVQALLVRPPDGALPAVQVYVAWDLGEYVWERLLDAGRGRRLTPLGVASLRHLQDSEPGARA
jgi:sarcosine oxidase subunit alpha